jgi:hypothetical protein
MKNKKDKHRNLSFWLMVVVIVGTVILCEYGYWLWSWGYDISDYLNFNAFVFIVLFVSLSLIDSFKKEHMKNEKASYRNLQLWLIALFILGLPIIYEHAYWFGIGAYDVVEIIPILSCINRYVNFLPTLLVLFASLSICKGLMPASSSRYSSIYKNLGSKYGYIIVFFLSGTVITFWVWKDINLYGLPIFSSIIILSILELTKVCIIKEKRNAIYMEAIAIIIFIIVHGISTAHLQKFKIIHLQIGKVELKDESDSELFMMGYTKSYIIVYNKKLNVTEAIPRGRVKTIDLESTNNWTFKEEIYSRQ